jgi:hypothetical protein
MPDNIDWSVVGDFNLIRKAEDRNKSGANANEIFMFNEALSALGLVEIPLKGRAFTWSNKQDSPPLERLDWFFHLSLGIPATQTQWQPPWPCSLSTIHHV